MSQVSIFTSILFVLLQSVSALAIPKAPFDALAEEVHIESTQLQADSFDFNGIVALSNCSASLVHFSGQPLTSKAYVLTNGHCISRWGGFLQPGEVIFEQSDSRSMNLFKTLNEKLRVRAESLVYATMTDTDAALYRLNTTYAELKQRGVHSFEMSFERPIEGTPIHVVSGYWKRGFACSIDHFVHQLQEANWLFVDSIRYTEEGCQIYGGTSGSPVIAQGERVVVGVNNTMNESGAHCTMNNPCEIDKNGNKTVIQNRGYGQQTYWFYSCLTQNFQIDLNLEGCLLPKGDNFTFQ